jgi:hypothetical protein
VDVSTAPQLQEYMHRYGARPEKFRPRAATGAQPPEHSVTQGNLCIKGCFGWRFVQK